MSINSQIELLSAAEPLIREAFARVTALAQARFESARAFTRTNHGEDAAQVSLSILTDPAADEIAIEVQLAQRATELWCEVTLYLGQTSPAILGWSVWNTRESLSDQICAIVKDLLAIVENRIQRIIDEFVGK